MYTFADLEVSQPAFNLDSFIQQSFDHRDIEEELAS
jgi:hypothetical protein